MYNSEIKERFLNSEYTNEDTKKNSKNTFEKISILEEQFNQDLYNFNKNQLYDALRLLNSTSISAITKDWSIMDRYIQWCTGEGYCLPNMNAQDIFKDDLKKFVNKDAEKNKYIKDEKELFEILNNIKNPQDSIPIALLYEGVKGRNEQPYSYEEIQNLTWQDCNYDKNELLLRRDNNEFRIITVSPKIMELIKDAYEEDYYYRGEDEDTQKLVIVRSDHIVRPIKRKDNTEKVGIMTINGRIGRAKKVAGKYYLNSKSIFYSGMFNKLQQIEQEKELTEDDYKRICKRYGVDLSINSWRYLKEKYMNFKKNYGI
jgi:hypothetical protein